MLDVLIFVILLPFILGAVVLALVGVISLWKYIAAGGLWLLAVIAIRTSENHAVGIGWAVVLICVGFYVLVKDDV